MKKLYRSETPVPAPKTFADPPCEYRLHPLGMLKAPVVGRIIK